MKAVTPKPVHASYQRHRRQVTSQIILPMILAAILFLALIVFLVIVTLFQKGGDLSRWGALSTMWILIPVFLAGLVLLVLLAGLVYLLARLLGIAPVYTNKLQIFVQKVADRIQKAADIPLKPIFFLDEVGATVKALFGRK